MVWSRDFSDDDTCLDYVFNLFYDSLSLREALRQSLFLRFAQDKL